MLANEHDGVVTLGEIPKTARREAAMTADLMEAKLEEKPFL